MHSQFTKQRVKKFLSYYKPYRGIFFMDMFFAAFSSVCLLLIPLVSGYITGEVLSDWDAGGWSRLFGATGTLLLLVAGRVAGNIIYAYFGHAMGARMEEAMRRELFEHYESLSFDFHTQNGTGKLITVLSNDLTNMTELFHHAPENLLMTAIKFIGAFVIMLHIHVPLTLIVFLALPLLAVMAYFADKRMNRYLLESKAHLTELNSYAEDILSGIRTVKAFGREAEHARRFQEQNRRYTLSRCLFYKVEAYFYETVEAYPQLLSMLVVVFGSFFLAGGSMDAAVLVTFLLYAGSLAEPIGTLLAFIGLFEDGRASFVRFMDMMDAKPEITDAADAVVLANPKGEISFDHVSFRYKGCTENVLEQVSFHISGGQTAALAGASGIGKTTVASLIARFYDVSAGSVRIDGADIRSYTLASVREHIGIVQQEVYLFNGSIRDNIRYGRMDASEEEIIQAAKLANIHDFILSLEKGYDTFVGTKGSRLSGGQRQRISIARLFLKDPKILIMDEATSALDYESERIVQQSLERLKKNRTSIVIAHRLSTIKDADQIFVLSGQRIAEQGTHDELMARNGEYAKLYRMNNR